MWKDRRVDDMDREELIDALKMMIRREKAYFSDEAIKARAQINVDLLRPSP